MTTYGLTATGFVPKPTPVIREEMNSEIKGAWGASLDLSDSSFLGFLVGIMAERYGVLWELAEQVNSSQDPDKATGAALDALCALTGTFRVGATPSTVDLTLTGTPTTVVASGSQARTASTEIVFETISGGTITALDAWVGATPYALDDRVTNSSRCYVCITAGTSAGSGGPTTTDDDITDGSAHWRYLGEGTGAVDVAAEATNTGPQIAVSGDITDIITPVGGWQSVINLLDADLGHDVGTDEGTRVQRGVDIVAPGTSPADAIRQALLQVPGVATAVVFVNNTDTTDGDGVPPHSIEALIQGGEDQAIWNALLANVAAGIATHGTEIGTATDSEGTDHTMAFSRPEEINIRVALDVTYDPDTYPSDGDDQVIAAIVAYGDAQLVGRDAVASAIGAQAFKVTGALDVPTLPLISSATAPATPSAPSVSTTITITNRQIAVYDTSRVAVNSTPGTP